MKQFPIGGAQVSLQVRERVLASLQVQKPGDTRGLCGLGDQEEGNENSKTGRPPRRDCIDVEGWMAGGRRKQLAYVMSKQHIHMMIRSSIRQLVVVFAAACRTSATEREQGKKFTEEA